MFLNMMKHIDFVEIEEQENLVEDISEGNLENIIGIWAKRDITVEKIREKPGDKLVLCDTNIIIELLKGNERSSILLKKLDLVMFVLVPLLQWKFIMAH